MKIKKGDNVKITCGKDKGKTGKVLQVLPKEKRAIIEGLNLRIKHIRPRREREKGQRIQFPAPLDISNLMLICPKCNKPTRVGYKVLEKKTELKKERKQRMCKKCKAII